MLEFLNPKICGFGIDLSDLSIKLAGLKKIDRKIKLDFNNLQLNQGGRLEPRDEFAHNLLYFKND